MGKQSTRENKTIYQQYREEQGLTREKASQEMTGVSASRIEKIEYELQEPTPYDIIQMADCYKPVCYTHRDVYKRQIIYRLTYILQISLQLPFFHRRVISPK